jgi:hypothetical protein
LKTELEAGTKLEQSQPQARSVVQENLRHWQVDPDLIGVRDPDALATFPPAERSAWEVLWSNVAARAK